MITFLTILMIIFMLFMYLHDKRQENIENEVIEDFKQSLKVGDSFVCEPVAGTLMDVYEITSMNDNIVKYKKKIYGYVVEEETRCVRDFYNLVKDGDHVRG